MKPEDIAEALRILRKRKGLTQENLAERLGVSRITVARWESGQRKPSTEQLLRLSKILEVPLTELIKGDTSKPTIKEFSEWLVEEAVKEVYRELGRRELEENLPFTLRQELESLTVNKLDILKEELKWLVRISIALKDSAEEF